MNFLKVLKKQFECLLRVNLLLMSSLTETSGSFAWKCRLPSIANVKTSVDQRSYLSHFRVCQRPKHFFEIFPPFTSSSSCSCSFSSVSSSSSSSSASSFVLPFLQTQSRGFLLQIRLRNNFQWRSHLRVSYPGGRRIWIEIKIVRVVVRRQLRPNGRS